MLKSNNKRSQGFTIIEVLIVLAIAGLILLIVFLAVPALQRNARNTTMKNDVQNVLGGVSEYEGANSGALPTTVGGTGTITYGALNTTSIKVQGSTVVATGTTAPTTTGNIIIVLKAKCDAAGTGTTANTRGVAALYLIETSGATVKQCSES